MRGSDSPVVDAIIQALLEIDNLKAWSEAHGLTYSFANQIKNQKHPRLGHETVIKFCAALGLDPATGLPLGELPAPKTIRVRIVRKGMEPQAGGHPRNRRSFAVFAEEVHIPEETEITEDEFMLILSWREAGVHPDEDTQQLKRRVQASRLDQGQKTAMLKIADGLYTTAMKAILKLMEEPHER